MDLTHLDPENIPYLPVDPVTNRRIKIKDMTRSQKSVYRKYLRMSRDPKVKEELEKIMKGN